MRMNRKLKRFFSMFLALLMVCSVIHYTPKPVQAATNAVSASSLSYGLMDDVQDGVILHCWDWSFNNIKAQMQTIAESGYSAIQTSPIQEAKESTKGVSNSNWWVFYQPKSFVIDNSGNSGLGTKAEFEAMCDEAHKYGIKVIVDIVANHTGNGGANGIADTVIDDIKNDPDCYHNYGNFKDIDYSNRYSITHDSMGLLPDLNTENTKIQNYVYALLQECIDAGADGFRFDAAKHISVPSEGSEYTFWPNVLEKAKSYARSTRGIELYCYGEVLDGTGGPAMTDYTQYMSVTENQTSNNIRDAVAGHNAGGAAVSTYNKGVSASKLVLWAESHDTYQNDNVDGHGESTYISNEDIRKTWALVASRANATALYYVRTTSWRSGMIGDICTWDWMSAEVVAANKFHNYFNGQTEYLAYSGNIAYNERGTSGVVLVNCSGTSTSVSVKANKMADGTYTDQVTGNIFTVSGGVISGQIGSTGVAVVYNPQPIVTTPLPTISKEGGEFSTDTQQLTIGLMNATSGTYKIGNGTAQTYTASKVITIGSDMSYGESVVVTLTATDGKDTVTKTYTFTKVEKTGNIAYLKLPSGWGTDVYCYAYDSATETINNGTWPGQKMTYDSSTGYYVYEIPDTIEAPRVIFYNSDSNRYPADMEKGLLFESDGSWLYADGVWSVYTPPVTVGKVTVKYVDESGAAIADSKTITGTVGTAYTTTAATVSGYTLVTTPANASGTYTQADITVTYVYRETGVTTPTVTTSLASGSTFTSETQTITLTLKNAVSGTYSVDNGPVKTFTGSASVVLGQGKVADSVVTVAATAKGSDGTTNSFTFTYNKKFNGTVNEETGAISNISTAAVSANAVSTSTSLDSQYSTNSTGAGVKKTITVDGDISDWNSSMIVAQGAANDDPRVYRTGSMYEVPVDLYALYACYDDENLYLMWEMTNVQDVVAPNDDYPLTQGILYNTLNVPFFIAIDTGDSSTRIGNDCKTSAGDTIWASGISFGENVNKIIAVSTNGANGPFIYGGSSSGLNTVEECSYANTGITFKYGMGIASTTVKGINGAYGTYNGRVVGDMTMGSTYVDFNTLGHSSSTMDFHYEMSIPLEKLGTTSSKVASSGLGVLLVATMGQSGMDCLPYDLSMNDNADLPYSQQEQNSNEKEDEDYITCSLARVGASGGDTNNLELNFGADRSSPQTAGTALTLNGIAQGGTAPYTYKYYVNNSLVATKSGTGATQTAWTPSAAGTYTIKCIVTDNSGNSVTSVKYYTVENGTASTLTVTGSASASSVAVGSNVTITASASGGTGSYTYSFLFYNKETGAWYRFGDFAAAKSYTWTASSTGSRAFYVEVKDSAGTVVRSSAINVNVTAQALSVTGSASTSSVAVGSNVTITASAAGGTGSYTYSFLFYNKETGAWYRFGSFTSAKSYTWTASSTGSRAFYVEVKDSAGTVVRSSAINVNVTAQALSVTGSASASSVAVGSNVTITASAAGGTGSYTYSFLFYNKETGAWYRFGSFAAAKSYTWTASSTGSRAFYVEVKDSAGTVVRSSAINVNVTAQALSVTGSASASSVAVGNNVTITASASGGTGSYTYSFLFYNKETGAWYRFGSFAAAKSYTWTASSTGSRAFYVEVKDSAGTVVRSSAINVNVTAQALSVTGKASATNIGVGTTIVITGTAVGGTGSYTYSFLFYNKDTGAWYRFGDFAASNKYSWQALSTGNRVFYVEVKDSAGTVVRSSAINVSVV